MRIAFSGEHLVIIERLLADSVCGTETNCCLTDERKYTRTDSLPFAALHNYIITYLGWSLAWWFWLLAVILLVFSSVFPSDWRLKDFLSCLLISDAIENFPDERLCDFNHDIEYHLLAVGVHFSSFWLPEELLKEMREQVHAGPFHGQAKKILYWITL